MKLDGVVVDSPFISCDFRFWEGREEYTGEDHLQIASDMRKKERN
jgi:hypothetical protein